MVYAYRRKEEEKWKELHRKLANEEFSKGGIAPMTREEAEEIVKKNFEEARKLRGTMEYARLTKMRIINDFLIDRFEIDWKKLVRPDEAD